jgi:alkaline phosphatase D
MTWDDHEFKDNYADLAIDSDDPLETVAARRAAAYLAYWEHSPLARSRKPVGKDMNLYRRARWGSLATFHVLDTRQHRSDQFTQCPPVERLPSGYCPTALDPNRGLLGGEQRAWLLEGLDTSDTSWNVLANQVGFAPVDTDSSLIRKRFSVDPWDGYVAERQMLLDFLAQREIRNMVVITGDAHEHNVRNVPPSYELLDGAPVATEFVGTSISSEWDPNPEILRRGGDANNPHILFVNNRRGYVRVHVDAERWTSEFRVVQTIYDRAAPAWTQATFAVANGEPGALEV